jgi:hypothetical protein
MAPKTYAIRIAGTREIENIGVAAYQITGPGGNRQIDVWLILRIPLVSEYAGHFGNR